MPLPPTVIEVDAALFEIRLAEREQIEGRASTEAERARMREQFADEELLLQHARARGLDRTSYVDRRLVRKMRFLLSGNPAGVSDAELRALYDADPSRFVPAGATEPLPFERVREQMRAMVANAGSRTRLEARVRELVALYRIVIAE